MPRELTMRAENLERASSNTWFVVQAFRKNKNKLVAEEPRMAKDERQCLLLAERVALSRPAVIAFKRKGDPDTGDFDDPVVLATYGEVPEMT